MKSDSEIRFDYNKAIRRAEELEEAAKSLKQLANRDLEDSLQGLANAWKGEAANAYISKGNQLQERILTNVRKLTDTAKTIRSTAKRTYDAEMWAYRIALERSYKEGN